MKKTTRVSNIWTTTANAATRKAASLNKSGIPRAVRASPSATTTVRASPLSVTAVNVSKENPVSNAEENRKLSLVDLEAELEREAGKDTLVDQEENTDRKGRSSWADLVREHQFYSKAFSETVSMQGLGPICDPKSSLKRKLVWFTIVALAIIFTAFNIYTQIGMFVGKPITVRVDFNKAKDITFPTITICNNNFASLASSSSFDAVQTLYLVKPLLFVGENSSEPDFSQFDFSTYRAAGWEVFYQILAQNMSQILLRCQWEQSQCSMENFTVVFTDMGLCYSFNVKGTLKAREAGRSYGLKLTLDTRQSDYLRSMDHYYGAGFRVVVHAASVPPIMSERGVAVSPGLHNFLAIDVKHLKNAEPSVSGCGSKELKYYKTTYSTEACRLECRTDVMNTSCGCRDLYMPNTDVRICDPPEFYTCVFPTLDTYLQGASQCEDLCPEPCEENLYRVTPSSNPFSQHFLAEFSSIMGQDADYWSQNLVHLEIYLTSMTYEKVEKQLGYTLLELFCDVGGAFGLLLGASLLTLLEIIDFFLCRISANGGTAGAGRGKVKPRGVLKT